MFLSFLFSTTAFTQQNLIASAQTKSNELSSIKDNEPEEVLVTVNMRQLGSFDITAMVTDQSVYMPLKELFGVLKIKVNSPFDPDLVTGFFLDPKAIYSINSIKKEIQFQNKIYSLSQNDLVNNGTELYLRSNVLSDVFGLNCKFDFRTLSVVVDTKSELPVVLEMQREKMRQNLSKLKGEKKADTAIRQQYPVFSLGALDWTLINTFESNATETKAYFNVAGIFAGGETNAFINYNKDQNETTTEKFFRWRLVKNYFAPLRQITVGNIAIQSTSSVFAPVNGIQLTNAPTTFRRSFGSYRLTDKTEPDWLVELYVNNVLVNYTKADASGVYTFDVPLVYGTTMIKLRFYGPYGEERTQEQNINVPFNFLPHKEFEYNFSAGIVSDDDKSFYSRANFKYGLMNTATIGGGVEYLSSANGGKPIPFVNAAIKVGPNILLAAEHNYNVVSKAMFRYQVPSSVQLEIDYTKYAVGQTAIRPGKSSYAQIDEERKAVLFMPFRKNKFWAFAKIGYNETRFQNYRYTSGDAMFSASIGNWSANLTTSGVVAEPGDALFFTDLSTSFRFKKGLRIIPQMRYDHQEKKISLMRIDAEQMISKRGFINISYAKDMILNTTSLTVGLRFNFSFLQTALSVIKTDKVQTIHSARGTVTFNDYLNKLSFDQNSSVGRGGLVLEPFLDLNCNGKRDKGEPKAYGLKLQINGGRINQNKKDTTIEISGLEAYNEYLIELDKNSFDNIAWQLKNKTMKVVAEPNHFKLVQIPVQVLGEVSGKVFLKDSTGEKAKGKILLNILQGEKTVAKVISEADGSFSYFGLPPGNYLIEAEEQQQRKLNVASDKISFTVLPDKNGPIVQGLKIVLVK